MDKINVDLLILYLAGKLDKEQVANVESWLEASTDHVHYFEELKEALKKQGSDLRLSSEEISQSWQLVSKETIDRLAEKETKIRSLNWRTAWRVAAVLILGIGLGYYLIQPQFQNNQAVPEVFASGETRQNFLLADGTEVWLNRYSSLTYQSFNDRERSVKLSGEGYFDVARDETRPFIIQSEALSVEVLGTSFNVRQLPDVADQIITVTSGEVAVHGSQQNPQTVLLTKGETVFFESASGKLVESTNDDLNFLSWKTGQLVFKESSLKNVLGDLDRHYDRRFRLSPELIDDYQFNATFYQQPLNQVIEVMELSLSLRFETMEDHYLVSPQ